MTNEDAAIKLTTHLITCGMLMPEDWLEKNGPGSDLQQAFRLALDALRPAKPAAPSRGDVIRSLPDEDLAWVLISIAGICDQIQFCQYKPECEARLGSDEDIPDEWCHACMLAWLSREAGGDL